ncbi:MAG: hypothetical protein HY013_07240, partial [Candidatus Solibacter usitatus]|nr:hypothetical protein [Candidatus Solibacter usitatus]
MVCAAGLPGQPPTPLDQVAARKEPDFSPAMEGKPVVVTGQISIRPTHVLDYVHLAIQDKGAGLVLEGKGTQFDQFSPGDWVEARGRVARRGGLPVVVVLKITTVTGGAAPEPRRVKVEDLQSFQYLGLRVNVEGRVVELGENAGGSYLRLGNPENPLKVFLPAPPAGAARKFAGFSVGDRVRVTGVSYQYCANPPYDRHFEVLVDNLSAVELLGHGWGFQIWAYKQWLVALVVPVLIWWYRERNAKAQREMLRTMYGLGEEILEAGSSGEISGRLAAVVPKVFPLTGVRLYFYDRGLKTFNCVTPRLGEKTAEAQSGAFSLESPAGLVESGVAACFENRNP